MRSQVEPRLVERRQRVEAAERRARRRRLAIVALVAALPVVGAGIALSPLLGVSEVHVDGLARLSEREVLRASGVVLGDNMVDVDLADIRRSAMAEPMVASAQVTRSWPTTIRIDVVEEEPLVRVHDGDRSVAVVSRTGRVLDPTLFAGEVLPSVDIDGVSELTHGDDLDERVRPALRVFEVLPDRVKGRLSSARITATGFVELELDDAVVVRFGSLDSLPAKLLALSTVLEQVSPECMAVLDITEPGRPTVTRGADCTPAEVTAASPEPVDEQSDQQPDETADEVAGDDRGGASGNAGDPASEASDGASLNRGAD